MGLMDVMNEGFASIASPHQALGHPIAGADTTPAATPRPSLTTFDKVYWVGSALALPALAYHGFKRNEGSWLWALGWAIAPIPWPIMVGTAAYQGFGKPDPAFQAERDATARTLERQQWHAANLAAILAANRAESDRRAEARRIEQLVGDRNAAVREIEARRRAEEEEKEKEARLGACEDVLLRQIARTEWRARPVVRRQRLRVAVGGP